MATVWITYAWADNASGDVDFVMQELRAAGVEVKLDRWSLKAGVRLWDQIAEFIQSPAHCDAWLMVVTQASLGSEPCREEYAYALDRALNTRGARFPVIALFPATVEKSLIPAGIRSRLYVSLKDSDWKERVVAGAEGRELQLHGPAVAPYHMMVHREPAVPDKYIIEVRPRAGTWSPFVAAIPASEKDVVKLRMFYGAAGRPQLFGALFGCSEGIEEDWTFQRAQNEATPTMSYFLQCDRLPSKLLFGVADGVQYTVEAPGK